MCLEHCERIFAICGDTPVDGYAVSSLYKSGRHFCEVHGYEVVDPGPGETLGQTCFNAAMRHTHGIGAAICIALAVMVTRQVGL